MKTLLSRRRFLQSLAVLGGSGALAACENIYRLIDGSPNPQGAAPTARYYPPALTGLRGDHDGSQTGAHSVALQHKPYTMPSETAAHYDLVVIGAGISGLTAAYLYRRQKPEAKILLLDNHDDFGGHAKRNEFTVNGRLLLSYGGSESIDSPETNFSAEAMGVLESLGIDYRKFRQYFQQDLYEKTRGLKEGVFFDAAHFGETKVLADTPQTGEPSAKAVIEGFPLAESDKAALAKLYTAPADYWAGKPAAEREKLADGQSYYAFLQHTVKLPPQALAYLQHISSEYWGIGTNALSVREALENGYPGVQKLKLKAEAHEEEPYIYHFPDGNASIARLLVRQLIPSAAAGSTMEDIVLADFDYNRLDQAGENVQIRLNSTALLAENLPDGTVAVAYLPHGSDQLVRVTAAHCIFAGHSALAARIMPQLPSEKRRAMMSNVKTPMVYGKALVSNSRAFQKLGVHSLYAPQVPYCLVKLDYPVDMGGYESPKTADEPMIIHLVKIATAFDGQTPQEMYRKGRGSLLRQPYEEMKAEMLGQLAEIYRAAGEDLNDSLLDVTLNRWAHGYSYEALGLFDSDEGEETATSAMQQRLGNILMAGSDVAWYPYLQGALEQAHRAVKEIFGKA